MIILVEDNKHNMKNYPGDYKGHSYKVLTSESIYDLQIEAGEDESAYDRMDEVCDEDYEILKKHLPNFYDNNYYPCISDFKSDSKKVCKEIEDFMKAGDFEDYEGYDLYDIYEDITYDYDKGLSRIAPEDMQDVTVGKMGGDLVLWDTGYIGYVGYGDYGPCDGIEILPIDSTQYEE